ncbi:MAG: divergent PAP2 family protein [Ruminococcaceae bacterium]|nr:divergent PAP2 family protein [Oscillospiraceae bacterium]
MGNFLDLFTNYHIICPFFGFITAQVVKLIITLICAKKLDLKKLFENGGMPSSHTSTVCALAFSLGIVLGFDSPVTAISFVLAMVVIIDALGVRRATGRNAKVINKIAHDLFEEKTTKYLAKDLKEYVGHEPLEVFVGAIIGIAVPYIAAFIMGII